MYGENNSNSCGSHTWSSKWENELVVFQPYKRLDWKTVNVDTTTLDGIIRAKELGLVQSHLADVIVSMEMGAAVNHLYDN